MDRIRESVKQYLIYEESEDRTGFETPPPIPEPLITVRRLRRLNMNFLWWPGGIGNQPYIWLAEINAAMDGEILRTNDRINAKKALEAVRKMFGGG